MDEQEFRIYVTECGQEPVVKDICGLVALEQRLSEVRNAWPNSTIVIREVIESVVNVLLAPEPEPTPPPPTPPTTD